MKVLSPAMCRPGPQGGVRALGDVHGVVLVADPHEVRDVTDVRRVEDDVRELDRDGLLLLDPAVLPDLDVGRDLDGAAVDVEEAEAVAAAGSVHLARLGDQLNATGEELLGERVHVGG